MNYQEFKNQVDQLVEYEAFNIVYKGRNYEFRCFYVSERFEKSYSIEPAHRLLSGMNVDKITNKYISLFSYDMMNQKSTYKMSIAEIEIKTNETVGEAK